MLINFILVFIIPVQFLKKGKFYVQKFKYKHLGHQIFIFTNVNFIEFNNIISNNYFLLNFT